MTQARPAPLASAPAAPRIDYTFAPTAELLCQPGTLAVLGFDDVDVAGADDPRCLSLALPGLDVRTAREHWRVDALVRHGRSDGVNWASGGGWLFAGVCISEGDHGDDIGGCAEQAYRILCTFLSAQAGGCHVQRIWNYLDRINEGEGDAERYKHFCSGRLRGMGTFFDAGFPAATAIGQPHASGQLTVYCLAADQSGERIENPRQMSAWRYPRQYGRTPPSFARAMLLPARDALAISGTAAITGHTSRHHDDLAAQLAEVRTNIETLLVSAGLPAGLDAAAPLKVYLRHPQDVEQVAEFFARGLPQVPYVLLQGDVCRRELLVEIDGWRYA
ncbi:MAG TPA: pteridine-dependent deoxygenase [Rhodanobacteraceae bacterium]